MSAVQSGDRNKAGGKPSSGQRQGPGQRPPSATRRTQAKPRSGQRPGTGRTGPAKGKAGTLVESSAPRRFSPATMGFVVVGVVVLLVVVLVVVKVTGGSTPTSGNAPTITPAPASLISEITGVPQTTADTVGVPSAVVVPSVAKNQPPLTGADGKPEVLFIGAEYCPFCAAERWALIMAFSRFGTWSGIQETTSSPWDNPPAVATYTFRDATYTSSVVDFTFVENETNDTSGLGTRHVLQQLTSKQSTLWSNYAAHFGVQTGYPFVDFGNKVFVLGPSYNPLVIEGLDQSAIAAKLSNPSDPVTQAIVGTANYLTAAICSITGQQPSSVCTSTSTVEASKALKLS